jgi:aryl-alcohol dehydrogenase-like predicted oxidoreductase
MEQRRLGSNGPLVSALGLGCMGMSDFYGPADDKESLATIDAALEAGVTLLDTGDFYGMGHNELLLREALKGGKRRRAFVQVKFGAQRTPDGAFLGFDARPAAVKTALAYTLKRLNTDYVDLYMPARLDPAVPIEETVGAIAELVKAGYVRHIGLSEMGAATIRRAHKVHPIAGLQIEYGLMTRGIEPEILPTLRELGIAVTAYGVLGRGLLGGLKAADFSKPGDFRAHTPRFQGENLASNLALAQQLETIASEKGVTSPQLAIAWALSRGKDIIPLVGTKNRKRLADALAALEIKLSQDDLARIEAAVPAAAVAGSRYDERQMQMLDSERRSAR